VPCTEMKELQAGVDTFNERRVVLAPVNSERRIGSGLARRASYARLAYLIQMHRQKCRLCRGGI
jgi:hypothetical protein